MWAAVAIAWKEHADYVDRRAAPVTARLLALADAKPGQRVLELGCGPGGLGLEAARLVGPTGHVVFSDVAQEMTDVALERAAERGIRNVSGRQLDLEEIDEAEASYDVVLCREGLMFALDHVRALREIYRVLKPGGRVALSVWGPRARNPWLGLVFDEASKILGRPVPPPGIPGPFSLDEPDRLTTAFSHSKFVNITAGEVAVDALAANFDEFWERTSALAGPLTKILASLSPAARDQLKSNSRVAFASYESGGIPKIPGVALVAAGTRPGHAV